MPVPHSPPWLRFQSPLIEPDDMALRFNDNVYLFEFKVVELAPEGAAMAQLKAKGYADKYRDRGEPIHLIGVEFSKEARNLAAFDVEQA